MIKRSSQFDLGLDTTRMKDPRDGQRQHETVDVILERFFNTVKATRWEIQILADEVGMGKTFVGLAVAYSILEDMMNVSMEQDLYKCYQKVLVITPNNSALYSKWQREVSEFAKRCVLPKYRDDAKRWFAPIAVNRIDELSAELRRPGKGARIIVANMSIFAGGKLRNHDLKRRFLLGILFRLWGNRFRIEQRERLLKGAKEHWTGDPYRLTLLDAREAYEIPFNEKEIYASLKRIENSEDGADGMIGNLLGACRELSEKYVQFREYRFSEIEKLLDQLYKEVTIDLIKSAFPLVIVDEAHNWKNHKNGYDKFTEIIACRTRRILLLTATPFQLHPEEMLKILEVSDHMASCATLEDSFERCEILKSHREQVIRPVLQKSASASRNFTKAWMRLPHKILSDCLAELWESDRFKRAKRQLAEIAALAGVASELDIQRIIDQTLVGVDPEVRQLMREALRLYTYNADLSCEMGLMVIRHRRRTEHRLFKVGCEYSRRPSDICKRPDSHFLHTALGIDVKGDGELPHYLLMRCVSEMKNFRGRSSLGNSLTGCYSTLLESKEGKDLKKLLKKAPIGKVYLDLLMEMVAENQDPYHPKVREVVDLVIQAWEAGEKNLIFCFRVNTAKRLKEIIDQEIRRKLDQRRQRCLGGEEKIRFLRSRLTSREQDLVTIGLDRTLWSFILSQGKAGGDFNGVYPGDLALKIEDLFELARLSLSFQVDLMGKRVDRVFLNRATEYIIAQRLLRNREFDQSWRRLLRQISDYRWVSHPYGLDPRDDRDDKGEEIADFDERGVHSRYQQVYDPDDSEVKELAQELKVRRNRALKQKQIPIIEMYAKGPNLWLGPQLLVTARKIENDARKAIGSYRTIMEIHDHLRNLTISEDGFDWESRRRIFQAMRKALLRESVLLRLLPERTDLEESGWGELLVRAFIDKLPGQNESMADRINIFLEDLLAASGSLSDTYSARYFLLSATRLSDQKFVALITGNSKDEERERVFAGFNTPLLPEVLICTAVGQEGIDLHRHCRHVIHYDLAWNPAVLEQRTGRADRIGSKTFRERAIADPANRPFLEIGIPFLAGTYDERMYEELRLRAQTFEVLTGGDLATDSSEGHDDRKAAEDEEREVDYVLLPENMVGDLRVKLHVWEETRKAG